MAKVTAHRKGDNITESKSISFSKDLESGFYRKIEQGIKSYHKEHKTKKAGKSKVSEELYRLSNETDWDYKFEVSGFDGKPCTVYFKEIDSKE